MCGNCWKHVLKSKQNFNNNDNNNNNNNVGGDLMMRRGMLPIIMLPDGDLRIVLRSVPFWILILNLAIFCNV